MLNSKININSNKNIKQFFNENQLTNFIKEHIPQDASSRKYYRLNNNLLLMESTSSENKNHEFIKVSRHLKKIGLSAPKIIKVDHKKGLYLIEDFGDLTFNKAIKNNISEELLYINAIRCLSHIHSKNPPLDFPKYDYKYLLDEVNLFIDWYFKEINIKLNNDSINNWQLSWMKIFKNLDQNKLVLRDFHADNLFWLPKRKDIRKVGLIDFQDALIGDEAYDISSLLEDVRRDVSEKTKSVAIREFIKLNKIKNKNKFIKNYNIFTAQRNAKIVGIFIRLARRDNKLKYLELVNKAMNTFLQSAKRAKLKEINEWIETHIPKNKLYL